MYLFSSLFASPKSFSTLSSFVVVVVVSVVFDVRRVVGIMCWTTG